MSLVKERKRYEDALVIIDNKRKSYSIGMAGLDMDEDVSKQFEDYIDALNISYDLIQDKIKDIRLKEVVEGI